MRQDDIDDDLFPLGAPDRPATARPRAGQLDLAVTWALFGMCLPLLALGWFGVVLSMFAFDACSAGGCNASAATGAEVGFPIAAAVSTVLLGIAAVRRRRHRRRAWALGLAAPLVVVALFVAATVIVHVATTPS